VKADDLNEKGFANRFKRSRGPENYRTLRERQKWGKKRWGQFLLKDREVALEIQAKGPKRHRNSHHTRRSVREESAEKKGAWGADTVRTGQTKKKWA